MLSAESFTQSPQVARGIVHVGLAHINYIQARGRCQREIQYLGLLAHQLPMHLAVGGDVDNQVPFYLGLTAEPSSVGKNNIDTLVARLGLGTVAEVRGTRGYAMLGIITFTGDDLAAATEPAATAD